MKYLTSDSLNSLLKPFSGFFDNNYSVMRTDVKSNDKEYTLSVDLPGIDKNNIDISLQDGYLTIEAVRNNEETEKEIMAEKRATMTILTKRMHSLLSVLP